MTSYPRPATGPANPPATGTAARFEALDEKVQAYRPANDLAVLRAAYEFSAREHGAQKRASGEPFLSHPLEVTHLLADMRMDITTLCVGLLHDVVEDAGVPLATINQRFGPAVARLVQGVTKINRLDFSSQEIAQAENLRKMLLAMVDDVRVILIKLADRLHNMRTLAFLPEEKRRRVAHETQEIYAPPAHRLGMGKMQSELAELAFQTLEPEVCARLRDQLEQRRRLHEDLLTSVQTTLAAALEENGIPGEIEGRLKSPYSTYQKMVRQRIDIARLYDLLAVRVVTDSVKNCYAALGIAHHLWRPVPGRFKDYIAMPRPNLYQSLHTSLMHPTGQPFEVQVRTRAMHRVAEQGIAAHWRYKDGDPKQDDDPQRIAWLRQLLGWAQDMADPSEFLSTLKVDLYPEEVYTFTPKGKVIVLPRQATPVDFAYAIHTDVGHTCTGAKVNGRLVSLRSPLQNGDAVEILTRAGHSPSRDWLSFVRTSRARHKIQHWIRARQRQRAAELGRRLLEREARRHKRNLSAVSETDWERTTREFGCQQVDELCARVGFGKYAAQLILRRLLPSESLPEERPAGHALARLRRTVEQVFRLREKSMTLHDGDLMMYRARCCSPIRGEPIVGYITRGRGISVHARHCPNVENLLYDVERRVEVAWAEGSEETYPVRLAIRINDRPALLNNVTGVIAQHGCNIASVEARAVSADGTGLIEMVFGVRESRQLDRILNALRKIAGVREVTRVWRI